MFLSGVCFCDGGQLFDPSLIVVPGQDGPIGVNVVHREEEGDRFDFGPRRSNRTQRQMWPQCVSIAYTQHLGVFTLL